MKGYTLDRDEIVVLQIKHVMVGHHPHRTLILTNKNIIEAETTIFDDIESIEKYSLLDLKPDGKKPSTIRENGRLTVFLADGERNYSFLSFLPAIRWSHAMKKAYKAAVRASRKKKPSPDTGKNAEVSGEGLPQSQIIKCPKCGYDIVIDPFRETAECTFCGTTLISDGEGKWHQVSLS